MDTERYTISEDPARVERDTVHAWLASTYWAKGLPREVCDRALDHSVCFGVYDGDAGGRQVAFCRLVTDHATFAWLADVYVDPSCRGQGIGKALVEHVLGSERLVGLRRVLLATLDAHGLYTRHGFVQQRYPERFLERLDRRLYDGEE